ncbi:hypothetical protein JHK82_029489 [Glycine max]|nr:hypothetical protein JHK82_029489 [Glycine max]
MRGLCKANKVREAENLLDEIVLKGLSPSAVTYNLLIDSWCKNGFVDKIMALLSRMSGEDREPNVISYSTLVEGLCRAERPDDALLVWNEMERKGCSPNWIAFMALIYGLCKCCRPTAALHYLRQMEQKDMKPYAFEIFKEVVYSGFFPESHDKNYSIVIQLINFPRITEHPQGVQFLSRSFQWKKERLKKVSWAPQRNTQKVL